MRIELRAATPGDVDTIAELWCAGWLDAHEGQVPEALLEHRTSTASGSAFRSASPPRRSPSRTAGSPALS